MTPKDWPGTAVVKVSCGIGGEAGAAAIGDGGSYDRRERDAERLDDGAVELRLLHRELVVDVVFFFGGEIGGGDLLHQ